MGIVPFRLRLTGNSISSSKDIKNVGQQKKVQASSLLHSHLPRKHEIQDRLEKQLLLSLPYPFQEKIASRTGCKFLFFHALLQEFI